MHMDGLKDLKKIRSGNGKGKGYCLAFCREASIPTPESASIIVSVELSTVSLNGDAVMRLYGAVFKPSLLNDAEAAVNDCKLFVQWLQHHLTSREDAASLDLSNFKVHSVYGEELRGLLANATRGPMAHGAFTRTLPPPELPPPQTRPDQPRLLPPIDGTGMDGEQWYLMPMKAGWVHEETAYMDAEAQASEILEDWHAQSSVYKHTTDPTLRWSHERGILDIRKVSQFAEKIVLARRCYLALCRGSDEPSKNTASLIVGVELCDTTGVPVLRPYAAAFRPNLLNDQDATDMATKMFVQWFSVLLRTMGARLDLSMFETSFGKTDELRGQLHVESAIHGFADGPGEKMDWSLAPQHPEDPMMAMILDEWAAQSLVYKQSNDPAISGRHVEAMSDLSRVRDYSDQLVAGRQFYLSMNRRDAEPDPQTVSAIASIEQIEYGDQLRMLLHGIAFKPSLLNDPLEFASSAHVLETSLFGLLNALGAKLDLDFTQTSDAYRQVHEGLAAGVSVMEAIGSAVNRAPTPPTVDCDGWHLVPKGPEDVFVDQLLEEWVGMSLVCKQGYEQGYEAGNGNVHLLEQTLSALKKMRLFSSSEGMYFFLSKDGMVPTSESVQLMIIADVDYGYGDYGGCKLRLRNLVFRPNLINDAEASVAACTRLVLCMIELMTKFGVWVDLDHLQISNPYSRLLHDKLSFWGANVGGPESGP
jgi:hypothetical protein